MTAAAPQILTTPTKGYNLRNRLVPLCSPDHLNGHAEDLDVDDIQSEPPPPEMNELACEALTEELKQMQVLRKNHTFSSVLRAVLQSFKAAHHQITVHQITFFFFFAFSKRSLVLLYGNC